MPLFPAAIFATILLISHPRASVEGIVALSSKAINVRHGERLRDVFGHALVFHVGGLQLIDDVLLGLVSLMIRWCWFLADPEGSGHCMRCINS